jgi:hypothetical protein
LTPESLVRRLIVIALVCGVVSTAAPIAAFLAPHQEHCGFDKVFFVGGPYANWLMLAFAVAGTRHLLLARSRCSDLPCSSPGSSW